jgi:serine/threonine protein kinase
MRTIEGQYTLTKEHSAYYNTKTYYAQLTNTPERFFLLVLSHREFPKLQPYVSLQHPNLCSIVALGNDRKHWVASEIEGESLDELVDGFSEASRLPLGVVLWIAAEVSAGLAFLHNNKLTHQYVKPDNIFCSNKGEVRVYGVGIVAACHELEHLYPEPVRAHNFDLTYCPLEMISGKSTDNRSDLFSLGGVLYCMLSRREPYYDESQSNIFRNMLNRSLEPLQPLAPGHPPALYALVEHTLQTSPEDRPQRAEDVEQTLRQLLAPLGGRGVRFDLGALVRLFRAKWRPPYGPYSGYLLREMVKLNEISWLSPDPELESLTPSALEWLEQRADEHLGALFNLFESADPPPCRIKVIRSLFDAKRLADREAISVHPQAVIWREAVACVLRRTEELSRYHPQWSSSLEALKEETLSVSFPGKKITREQQMLLSSWWDATGNPSERTLLAQVTFMMIFADLPSPWAPLCEMWVRGVWPLVFSEEGLLVYVPVLQNGMLVPSPNGTNDDKELPNFTLPL